MSADLWALLEADTLTYIRTAGIFLVFCVALFNFTDMGKAFSMVSLLISFILFTTVIVYYFNEKKKLADRGISSRPVIDIMMYSMVAVVLLILWILWVVWETTPISIGQIAKEIEDKIEETSNAGTIRSVFNLEKDKGVREMGTNAMLASVS